MQAFYLSNYTWHFFSSRLIELSFSANTHPASIFYDDVNERCFAPTSLLRRWWGAYAPGRQNNAYEKEKLN